MKLAYTMAPGRGDVDLLLLGIAEALQKDGYRLGGTVQINTDIDGGGPCDMDVKVLPEGPVLRISQSLGRNSTGCRLNPEALEQAVGLVEATFADGMDLLIVNKFGKHEAEGRGFRPLIAEALSRDIPVLVGLNGLNKAAFLDFAGGAEQQLPPSKGAILDWLLDSNDLHRPAA